MTLPPTTRPLAIDLAHAKRETVEPDWTENVPAMPLKYPESDVFEVRQVCSSFIFKSLRLKLVQTVQLHQWN
jgi:uncharacterized protein YijF (DUF1287 family)